MKYVVAQTAEIPPGTVKIVEVGKRSIGIFNLAGDYYALRNRCPHQGASLCEGKLWGKLESAVPGDICYDPEPETISCPWHGWEFEIRTGQSWCEPSRVRTGNFSVSVAPGSEILEPGPANGRYRVKGPYVAETVEVTVENDYVAVEIR
jgi:nitrite reductase/ring-hydroxylating ferredoxin subunit